MRNTHWEIIVRTMSDADEKQKSAVDVFFKQKTQALSGVDLSRKGEIDRHIKDLVTLINDQDDYFTTSSCSGRILLFVQREAEGKIKKRNCVWLKTTHDPIEDVETFVDDAFAKISDLRNEDVENGDALGTVFLKFEPMILHARCRDLESARKLHSVGLESGFKNSGLGVGKKGAFVSAIRAAHGLETPLTNEKGELIVDRRYLLFVTQLASKKLANNFESIDRLSANAKRAFDS